MPVKNAYHVPEALQLNGEETKLLRGDVISYDGHRFSIRRGGQTLDCVLPNDRKDDGWTPTHSMLGSPKVIAWKAVQGLGSSGLELRDLPNQTDSWHVA
jgi:hypothetical protein